MKDVVTWGAYKQRRPKHKIAKYEKNKQKQKLSKLISEQENHSRNTNAGSFLLQL